MAADDIVLFAGQGEDHLGILACHELDVAIVPAALEAQNLRIPYGAAQSAEGHLQLVVLQHHFLVLALKLGKEEGAAVGCRWRCSDHFGLCLFGFCLLLALYGGDAIPTRHRFQFLSARLVVPTEKEDDKGNAYKSCNGVSIHSSLVV